MSTFTEQLATLASQHHASPYNRAKFGPKGSPFPYLPLSIQLPEQFYQLRQRQLLAVRSRPWWPAYPLLSVPTLDDDLMDAMSEPLATYNNPSLKNSVSHPINISMIIPPDLVALISSHALFSAPNSPTAFELPAAFTLSHLSSWRDSRLTHTGPISQVPPFVSPLDAQTSPTHFRTRSHVSDALQAAINSGMSKDDCIQPEHVITGYIPHTTVALSLSMTLPRSPTSSFNECSRPTQSAYFTSPVDHYPPTHDTALRIGNFFLSSCPGKKVRLDGPVKGRNGVCRDLETDLKRMKELGVRCIVCCLDDTELELLGVPWPEYERGAKKIGLDVLRLPIPEGLPPLSAASLDVHLVDLIHRYTLKGFPILAHCRGGVGRAGLIACCWMIRLGLCGSINQSYTEEGTGNPTQDVFSFIDSVIELVRRRRSMKAIETYEQVKFLVEYVEYLWYGLLTPQEVYTPA